ncbi:pyrophosphatase PpaX [Vagococcus entomophilus]|uniref:Pyrophosphatase PpaX n=1 Tax=Vagococcus entomophilus TaxID=1160095 RepID=A0A430AJ54_9ENTE|nr:pyrophosphatase PpaX [Vagococcus entomophilus]RSU08146.1 pyrophosphatase PpaX [Vagococcus entomophilus]
MKNVETILFDFDGTLANTNQLIASSHEHVLNRYFPGQYDKETILSFNGPSLKEVYESVDPKRAEFLISEYRSYNERHHDEKIKAFDGVVETLNSFKENGLKLGIVSTKAQPLLNKGLKLLNIIHFFDIIISGSDCILPKPDPEGIQKAMCRLQAKKETTIMVGDNYHDIEAAHRANIAGVFVTWSEKSEDVAKNWQADYTISSMYDLQERIFNKIDTRGDLIE